MNIHKMIVQKQLRTVPPVADNPLVFALMAAAFVTVNLLNPIAAVLHASPDSDRIEIRVLSSMPRMVTGGSALVKVDLPSRMGIDDVRIVLNGKIITNDFHSQSGGAFIGLAQGMSVGKNHFAVLTKASHWHVAAELEIVNYPINGPIFSGPQQSPFVCETATFVLPVTGSNLGPPLDADCSIAARVDYVYKSDDGTFKPLPNPKVFPADLVKTTTTEGRTVNYIVRIETGTINRAIYQTAILHDTTNMPVPSPWSRLEGWNGRLIYIFGGGCRPGYHQGSSFVTGGPLNDLWLSQGYAAATSSLNVFDNNCNDVISAETMMMVKEHFIERYGAPLYTIGWGASGGSMQQHLISHNYPGLLDGITPSLSFPDAITFFSPIADCALLAKVFDTSMTQWTREQKAAVAGWGTWDFCTDHRTLDWGTLTAAGFNSEVQVTGCRAAIPIKLIYDRTKNPTGARCTWFDNSVNVFGRDSQTGFARRTLDNVGVQYGFRAFMDGTISVNQFIELNKLMGGYDVNGNITNRRMVGDPEALHAAYETGRVNEGSGLDSVPIIDFRPYRDLIVDVHDSVRSHIMRARLIAANGTAANQVMFVTPPNSTTSGAEVFASISLEALRLMDNWLANIASDRSPYKSLNERVVRNKPAGLADACYGAAGEKITDEAKCEEMYPIHGNPRIAAGQPLSNDILKCQLKAIDARDYGQSLTEDQILQLKAIFPLGVCDYSRPGIGQVKLKGTWLAYPHSGIAEVTGIKH